MSYANGTTHYNLPQTVGTDKRDWSDANQAFRDVDTALYQAVQATTQAELDIDALEVRMDTAEQNIADNASDISGLDGRLTTAEGTITQHTTQIADVRQDTEDMICAFNEASATSTHAYAMGDYFIYNDVLYRATASIGVGDTIVPDTNCTTTNVTSEIHPTIVLGEVTADGLKSIRTILNELFAFYLYDPNGEYIIKDLSSNGNVIYRHETLHSESEVWFFGVSISGSSVSLSQFTMKSVSNVREWDLTTSGNAVTESSDTFIPASGRKYSLLKLATSY